jgi:hypothetical protein
MLLGCCLVAPGPAGAQARSSSFRLEIPAGRFKVARLRSLPQGRLHVDVTTSGPVQLLVFDQEAYRRFPSDEAPLFRGRAADRLGFSIRVPRAGDYFLVLDNRAGARTRQISVNVKATSVDRPPRPRPRDLESMRRALPESSGRPG